MPRSRAVGKKAKVYVYDKKGKVIDRIFRTVYFTRFQGKQREYINYDNKKYLLSYKNYAPKGYYITPANRYYR